MLKFYPPLSSSKTQSSILKHPAPTSPGSQPISSFLPDHLPNPIPAGKSSGMLDRDESLVRPMTADSGTKSEHTSHGPGTGIGRILLDSVNFDNRR